jgi:hypothetical protein
MIGTNFNLEFMLLLMDNLPAFHESQLLLIITMKDSTIHTSFPMQLKDHGFQTLRLLKLSLSIQYMNPHLESSTLKPAKLLLRHSLTDVPTKCSTVSYDTQFLTCLM